MSSIDTSQVLRIGGSPASASDDSDLVQRLEQLNAIGASLSAERDINRLLESILTAAKTITRADGGTLYRVADDRTLRFEIVRTSSLKYYLGGTTGNPVPFYPIQLYRDGKPNHTMVAAYAALTGNTVNIADAYAADGFDFAGTRAFDSKTGYRSKSFLTVPMRNHENLTIGVLQLINAQNHATGEIVPFSPSDQRLAESLASQAAIALTNRMLINQLEQLFESFINVMNTAIDEKSP
jgi:GAF domain-containing protein